MIIPETEEEVVEILSISGFKRGSKNWNDYEKAKNLILGKDFSMNDDYDPTD